MNRERWWLLIPRSIRQLPADLAAVLAAVGLTLVFVFVPVVNETLPRVFIGLVFVLFVPGYAFIAALFPEAPTEDQETIRADSTVASETGRREDTAMQGMVTNWLPDLSGTGDGVDGIERVALSFGTSIALVPLFGLVLSFTPWGIRLASIVLVLSGFTVVMVGVSARRRWALPEEERFRVPYRAWIATAKSELFDPDSRTDAALNVLLVVSILLAASGAAYAVTMAPQGEHLTEFYVLTEDDDGELQADGYPEVMAVGESAELVVGIDNQEFETVDYTVVVQLQRVEFEDDETRVLERDEIDRFGATLEHNSTRHERRTLSPTFSGEDLRLQFLLYRGAPPEEPTVKNAYRDVRLWIDVEE